jgi:hypothetical protein
MGKVAGGDHRNVELLCQVRTRMGVKLEKG